VRAGAATARPGALSVRAEPAGGAGVSGGRGALALLLHSHMPYVEGFDTWPFGEEWLWEAVAGVYLPLLEVIGGAPVTLGLTPVLCDQFEAMRGDAGERYVRFMHEVRVPIHAEDALGLERGGEHGLADEVRRAAGDYEWAARRFEERSRDLLSAFAELEGVELWTSAATHAVLPLLVTDAGRRLQLATGVASHERRFGDFGGGFWLPECAYEPGLERDLDDHGVRAFCVDQTAAHGYGAPEQLEPVATEAGSVAIPVDWETVELVWCEDSGYPAHGTYRNYHGRTVHDLKPWNNAGHPYRHEQALALAREHARDFVERAVARLDRHAAESGRPGLLACPLDTELLGHWWYEGTAWLEAVLGEAGRQGLELVTLCEGIERVEPVERELQPSTWGRGKDLSTWDSALVAQIAFAARNAELRVVSAAPAAAEERRRALERAARELLALQSSDWAFQVTHALASDYPLRRVEQHSAGVDAALAALTDSAPVPEPKLRALAPDLDIASLVTP
jgi:1,4-alpha-glucan branching enzyme